MTLTELIVKIRGLIMRSGEDEPNEAFREQALGDLTDLMLDHAGLIADVLEMQARALGRIAYGEAHIGNDANGNIFEAVDHMVCWKCTQVALSSIAERLKREGDRE